MATATYLPKVTVLARYTNPQGDDQELFCAIGQGRAARTFYARAPKNRVLRGEEVVLRHHVTGEELGVAILVPHIPRSVPKHTVSLDTLLRRVDCYCNGLKGAAR